MMLFISIVFVVAGCTEPTVRNYANAIGPELYASSTVKNTRLLEIYSSNLCYQASLPTTAVGSNTAYGCNFAGFMPATWKSFVEMGVYDIDRRCDAFLESLYYKEKSRGPILRQITNTSTVTREILNIAAASNSSIRIVAAAFDFASNSFSNVRNGLLDALDQTTVKSLVYGRQKKLKEEIAGLTISSKPAALNALRAYLRVCMPFTIEMEANSILTTVQKTGTQGESLINASALKIPRAEEKIVRDSAPTGTKNASNKIEAALSPLQVRHIQRVLCVGEDADYGKPGSSAETRRAISNFKLGAKTQNPVKTANFTSDDKLNKIVERSLILDAVTNFNIANRTSCQDAGLKSSFEAGLFTIDGVDEVVTLIRTEIIESAAQDGKISKKEKDELLSLDVAGLDENFRRITKLLREQYSLEGKEGIVDIDFMTKVVGSGN
ncbi:hypothetical protein WNZ14_21945 [Hoeflea sp. AS60]|uniref:hypothetical protein n=1 Tax=Hoeflea sp. AS60 TaxID=3135780 RepID=UPI00317EEF2E